MSPESLLRKAQALGDDIKEMESIDVLGAYYLYFSLLWFWDIYILVEQKPTRNMQRW